MKKILIAALTVFFCSGLLLSVYAAHDGPQITMELQSPDYSEYSVAIYTLKASGNNLKATWFMEWQGQTYTISDIGGSMEPWEGYAGETYGAQKPDDNTFIFQFSGIESELDGAYLWCVVEDGHFDVTSQKCRVTVTGEGTPPEILSIPTCLSVEKGDAAEIRCVAKSADESQLTFLWYETDSGKREDLRAVNRGAETTDYLILDTSQLGTRNYLCLVQSENGGKIYSSIVPVTVTEKNVVTAPPETSSTAANSAPSVSTTANQTALPTVSSDSTPEISSVANAEKGGTPWWLVLVISAVAVGVGVCIGMAVMRSKNREK